MDIRKLFRENFPLNPYLFQSSRADSGKNAHFEGGGTVKCRPLLKVQPFLFQTLPCPTKEFFLEPVLVFASGGFWETYQTRARSIINALTTFQILFFSATCIYYLFISKSSHVSAQTRRLQIRSFFILIIQVFIPIMFIMIPVMITLNRSKRNVHDQMNNSIMTISFVSHSGVASLAILLVHAPYRKFLMSMFRKEQKVQISHASSNFSLVVRV